MLTKKPGRPALNEEPLSPQERVRRHRESLAQNGKRTLSLPIDEDVIVRAEMIAEYEGVRRNEILADALREVIYSKYEQLEHDELSQDIEELPVRKVKKRL